jgi:hypothetical protein
MTDAVLDYRRLNRLIFLLLVSCLAAGWFFYAFRGVLPRVLTTCASLRVLGRPCPLCGLTRGLAAVLWGALPAARAWNPLAPAVAAALAGELLFRAVMAFRPVSSARLASVRRVDAGLHLVLGAAYLAYAAWFYATA